MQTKNIVYLDDLIKALQEARLYRLALDFIMISFSKENHPEDIVSWLATYAIKLNLVPHMMKTLMTHTRIVEPEEYIWLSRTLQERGYKKEAVQVRPVL